MRYLAIVCFVCCWWADNLFAAEVPFLIPDLFLEQEVPLTDIDLNGTAYVVDGIIVNTDPTASNGPWSFSETDMVGLSTQFNNNRHEFVFSDDGISPITVDGDEHWRVSFDVALDGTLLSPRKAFNFVVFDGGSLPNQRDSFINLTTNRSPNTNGLSDPPGESAMFGGEYNFVRLIGPADGDPGLNLNPTVGYVGGDTISLEIIHTPSPDGGMTPSTVEHIYDDGTGPYTTGPRELRRSGVFANGAKLGFIIQGIAHSGTPVDSHTVNIENLDLTIGKVVTGDFNGDGDFACDDIDPLIAEIAAGTNDAAFDLTGDGLVNLADRDAWLAEAGAEELASGAPYLLGDATLDGNVNGQDFVVWNNFKFTATGAWCQGDFNADGTTDGQDFVIWNDNKFMSADAQPVPEPVTGSLLLCLLAIYCRLSGVPSLAVSDI